MATEDRLCFDVQVAGRVENVAKCEASWDILRKSKKNEFGNSNLYLCFYEGEFTLADSEDFDCTAALEHAEALSKEYDLSIYATFIYGKYFIWRGVFERE